MRWVQAGNSLHQHLRALADGMLASLAQDGVSARVQKLIRAHPRWGKERIGEQLGMSGRHLSRKLAAEAISFKGPARGPAARYGVAGAAGGAGYCCGQRSAGAFPMKTRSRGRSAAGPA